VDCDNSGGSEGGDIVLGVSKPGSAANYAVTYENAGYGNPSNSFGAPVPAASGSYLFNAPAGPTATYRDFECTINNYSQMPYTDFDDRLHDEVSFGIHVYSGSWEDGVVGYDKFTNSGWMTVVIPGVPETDTTITRSYPRDLYVLEGFPMDLPNGNPPTVLGYPFLDSLAGWPNWRVSRWDSEHQTYIRYGEPDYPVNLGLDPPPFQPGMGFWIVQDLEDTCECLITGSFFGPGDTVRVLLQSALPNGTPGQNMLANPFHVPIEWGDCLIQRADHSQPPMTIMQAFNAGIACHYAATWDPYTNQYTIKDVDDEFGPFTGFWTCVFDSLYEWEIIYVYPEDNDAGSEGIAANAHPYLQPDMVNNWSFYLGVVVDNLRLVDQCNYIGISSTCSDVWDAMDAGELAPMTTGGYVHLYFPHTDWAFRPNNYSLDFRQGPFTGTKIWDFDVRSYQYAGDVLLVWDGCAQITPEYIASLLDEGGTVLVEDMTLLDVLPITISSGEIQHYQVKVERVTQGVDDNPLTLISNFHLAKVYPNPFNPETTVSFTLPYSASVRLSVYDINGRMVQEFGNRVFSSGSHTITLDMSKATSGVYTLRAETEGRIFGVEKLLLIK
jgi:hypothetical protein